MLRTGSRLVNVCEVLGEVRQAVILRLRSNPETVPGKKSASRTLWDSRGSVAISDQILPRSHQQPKCPFLKGEGHWCQHHWLALTFREIESSEAARRSRLLCSHRNSPILSLSLRPLRFLNYNNPRPPCSIRSLLNTHDGATNN